jgi:translation elongation factor P/translation initiation factor 5A
MINYEYESRMSFDFVDIETTDRLSVKERILTQKAKTITEKIKNI